MNAVKNRAPFFSRSDNMVEAELRHILIVCSASVAERLGGIKVTYLAGSNAETEILVWVDADPIPRLLKVSLPFSASFADTVRAVLQEIEKTPAPNYAAAS